MVCIQYSQAINQTGSQLIHIHLNERPRSAADTVCITEKTIYNVCYIHCIITRFRAVTVFANIGHAMTRPHCNGFASLGRVDTNIGRVMTRPHCNRFYEHWSCYDEATMQQCGLAIKRPRFAKYSQPIAHQRERKIWRILRVKYMVVFYFINAALYVIPCHTGMCYNEAEHMFLRLLGFCATVWVFLVE